MADDKTLKETVREERRKLKGLSFKKKIEYIWDYYKPLMAGIIGVVLVICIIVQMIIGKQRVTELTVAFVNCYAMEAQEEVLHDEFVEYSGLDGDKQDVLFDTTYTLDLDGMDQMTMANQMKIAAVMGAQTLDVMIMPEELYKNYLGIGAYYDLEEVMGTEFLERYQELWQMDKQEDDVEEKIYGLKLAGNERLKELYGDTTVYLTVVANTQNKNNAEKFVQYVLS